jgi:hypothetical protein
MSSKRLQFGVLALILMLGLAGCASYLPSNQKQTVYDSIPQESNFVAEADVLGLLEDKHTVDTMEGIGTEFGAEEGFYEDELDKSIEQLNSNLDEEIDSADVQVEDVERVYMFGNISVEEENIQNAEPDQVGGFMDVSLTAEDLSAVMEELQTENADNENLQQFEYNGHTVLYSEAESEDIYITVLNAEEGRIAYANDRAFMETIIDTSQGESESIDKTMIPEKSQDAYVSFAYNDAPKVIEPMKSELEGYQDQPMYEELSDKEKEQLDTFMNTPSPESMGMVYYTENGEMILEVEMNFPTEDAASEWQRIFEDSPDSVDVDVSVSTTTVTMTATTTSDSVVDETVSTYEEFMSGMSASSSASVSQSATEDRGSIQIAETGENEITIQVESLEDGYHIQPVASTMNGEDATVDVDVSGEDTNYATESGQTIVVSEIDSDVAVEVYVYEEGSEPRTGTVLDFYLN